MWQKSLVSQANAEEPVSKTEQGPSLDQMEPRTPWTETLSLGEACKPNPGYGRRLAHLGWKLCRCFFHRWFNLYDLGLEEEAYVSPLLRRFAEMDLCRAAAPQEMAAVRSRSFPERDSFLGREYSSALPGRESKSGIPWKSPWVYLSFLLLAWLFVL